MTVAVPDSRDIGVSSRVPAFLLLGAAVGVLVALGAGFGPSWAAFLAHYGAGYVLLTAMIGVFAPSPFIAAIRAVACFVPFVLVYYAVVQLRFGAIPTLYATAWLGAALVICPAAALAVRWSRDRGAPVGAAVAACAAAGVLADGTVRTAALALVGRFQGWGLDPTFAVVDLAIVAAVVLVVPTTTRGRVLAAILTLPLGFIATALGLAAHYGPGPYR